MAFSNFITGMKNLWIGTSNAYNEFVIPSIITGSGQLFDLSKADQISTVYTAIKILAETVSRLPLNVYTDAGEGRTVDNEHYLYPLLHYQPNNWTAQQTFFSCLEYWRNMKGNSFARIYRQNGKAISLVLVPPSKIKGYDVINGELYYDLEEDEGKITKLNASELLHFKGLTKDGIWGLNPLEALRLNISTTGQGLTAIDSFYANNAMVPKVIESTVTNMNQKNMKEAINEFNAQYAGASKAGLMAALPPNTKMVDMALNFADAEFISTIKFNTTQIGALYGIPAWMLGILESTKFSSVELMMLEFKSTTLAAITRMYRQEMEMKLLKTQERLDGVSIEFNLAALTEADSTTRISNLRTLQGMGVVTPNDVCKLEGFPTYPAGDEHYMPGNFLTVNQIATKTNQTPPQKKPTDPQV